MARRIPFVGRLYSCIPPLYPANALASIPEAFTAPASPSSSSLEPASTTILDADPSMDSTSSVLSSFARLRRRRTSTGFWSNADEDLSLLQHSQEYVALIFSFLFLVLESFLRIVTLALPAPVINFFYGKSRSLFNAFSQKRHTTVESSRKEKTLIEKVREADGFVELCELWNADRLYKVEEHVVQTGDGYLLGLHRVVRRTPRERARSRTRSRRDGSDRGNGGRKVVYLHHGLLMNSEVWVCRLEKDQNLPFALADKGYDVWLGNNRGNKYSKKSIHHSSNTREFWDFSMDEFAFHDIPDSINYILETTKQRSLSYVGFSQGTAQAFATLSIHPTLNEKIDVFIALAPAMSPAGLSNAVVDALTKTSPNMMYLFFGRKSILSSATFWQSILYPPIFVRLIDISLVFLFNWTNVNISLNQKIAAYSHLYSFTSVKSVVHWFQIMRNKNFQMYDDDMQSSLTATFTGKSFYKVAKFPTRNITAPVHLVYGGSDSLVDINVMLKELPSHTVACEVPHYEHLDFLWGKEIDTLVFPHVFEALDMYSTTPEKEPSTPENAERPVPNSASAQVRLNTALKEVLPSYSEDEARANQEPDGAYHEMQSEPVSPPTRNIFSGSRLLRSSSPLAVQVCRTDARENVVPAISPTTDNQASSSDCDATRPGTPVRKRPHRSSSGGSIASIGSESRKVGERGIQIGMSRPVAAVSASNIEDTGRSTPKGSRPKSSRRKGSINGSQVL